MTAAVLTASRLLVAVTARSLSVVEDAVTLPQMRLLVVLHGRGPSKLVELADRLGVNPSTAMRMVDRLQVAGLISRQVSRRSRREVAIELTEAGRRLVDTVTARRREEIAAIVGRMDTPSRVALVAALAAFNAAGAEPPAERVRDATPLGWE